MGKVFQKVKRSADITHKIMSAIHSKDTKPEIALRKELWKRGLRYRKNYKNILGKPDIAFVGMRIAVFVDGDFWHGHNWELRNYGSPSQELERYTPYWREKIRSNVERDLEQTIILRDLGWTVLRYWESDVKEKISDIADEIEEIYKKKKVKANG